MPKKRHPLVTKTKTELERLDKQKTINTKQAAKTDLQILPISVEPKLRNRAFVFMDALINELEKNNHSISFDYDRCHIKMFGELTEINLRQKYFRKRVKDDFGYSRNTYEKSNLLEFQVGSYARKGWLENDSKKLLDHLPSIYSYVEKASIRWAEIRKDQRLKEEQTKLQKLEQEKKTKQEEKEKKKVRSLITDSENFNKANMIRSYINAYQKMVQRSNIDSNGLKEYLIWANSVADELDPICQLTQKH